MAARDGTRNDGQVSASQKYNKPADMAKWIPGGKTKSVLTQSRVGKRWMGVLNVISTGVFRPRKAACYNDTEARRPGGWALPLVWDDQFSKGGALVRFSAKKT